MVLQTKPSLTPEDYLAIERSADYKNEYLLQAGSGKTIADCISLRPR